MGLLLYLVRTCALSICAPTAHTVLYVLFFCKQKSAYEMRISDWSSDVCSSDLSAEPPERPGGRRRCHRGVHCRRRHAAGRDQLCDVGGRDPAGAARGRFDRRDQHRQRHRRQAGRSEEHTSELQSLMRISYAVFCLKKKQKTQRNIRTKYTYTWTQHSTNNTHR